MIAIIAVCGFINTVEFNVRKAQYTSYDSFSVLGVQVSR